MECYTETGKWGDVTEQAWPEGERAVGRLKLGDRYGATVELGFPSKDPPEVVARGNRLYLLGSMLSDECKIEIGTGLFIKFPTNGGG